LDEITLIKTEATENWFSRGKAEADKGIPYGERVTGIIIVVVTALIMLYFIAHQIWSTGFFTAKFDTFEMIMLYGSLLFMIVSSSLEGIFGQRLLSRIWDAFGGLIFATIGIIWLLLIFPFEFTYFADVLPSFLRFLLQWISNDVARVLMVLLFIVTLGAAIYTPIAYKFVRLKRSKRED
jgi:hypothetical protein